MIHRQIAHAAAVLAATAEAADATGDLPGFLVDGVPLLARGLMLAEREMRVHLLVQETLQPF